MQEPISAEAPSYHIGEPSTIIGCNGKLITCASILCMFLHSVHSTLIDGVICVEYNPQAPIHITFQCYIAGIHQNALKRYPDAFCIEAIKDYRANIVILFADLLMSDGGPKRYVNGALVLLGIDCFLSLYKDTTLCSLASSKHGPFHLDDYMLLYIV